MLRKTLRKKRKEEKKKVDKLSIRKNFPKPHEVRREFTPGSPAYFANLQKDDNWYNTKED